MGVNTHSPGYYKFKVVFCCCRNLEGELHVMLEIHTRSYLRTLSHIMSIFSLGILTWNIPSLEKLSRFNFLVPPQLNPELKNRSIALNSAFATHCFERGDPPVKINWTKNGERLGNNNTLVISYVTFEDAGIYECTAKNHAGMAKATFSIGVHVRQVNQNYHFVSVLPNTLAIVIYQVEVKGRVSNRSKNTQHAY